MLSSYRMDHASSGKKGNTPACLRLFAPRIGRLSGVSRILADAPRRCVLRAVLAFGLGPSTRQWPFPRRCFEPCRAASHDPSP